MRIESPNPQKLSFWKLVVVTLISSLVIQNGFACSGYKITVGNKTIMGSNEDAWRTTPHIWFEKANGNGHYGVAFTGSRYDGANGYAPQSGMNEMGLAFERLASYHPEQQSIAGRKAITNPTNYLKDLLHTCKTVKEVKAYISQYDHSYFMEDVFLYVDASGEYLVVEPYTLTLGNDPNYVISNFCPSITSEQKANTLTRYRNGVAFLEKRVDTSLAFCTALSDTMHVCRDKIGDGTLLSSIWDLQNKTVTLYFYHDYKTAVRFNLAAELQKGNHRIAIQTLFPKNQEFEHLSQYKTPKNSTLIGLFILAAGGFFLLSSLVFFISYFRKRNTLRYASWQLLLAVLGLCLVYYMFVLSVSINVFYFSAPYKDPGNLWVSLSSYLPFVLVLLLAPLVVLNVKLLKESSWSWFSKVVLTLYNGIAMVLIGLFVYWRFYSIFG